MKKISLIITALFLATSLSYGQTPVRKQSQARQAQVTMSVDSIFDKYYQATGGESLWKGINNYTMKRSYRSNSSADYDADIYVSLPENAMHKAKIILKRNFIYAVKGADGWMKIPLGSYDKVANYQVKDLSRNEQDNMRMEMYDLLVPFISYQDRGLIATYVGTETLNGKQVNQVELQGKGVKYNLYFDSATGLLVRQRKSLPGEEVTVDYSNYKKSGYGIMYPATAVETNSKDKRAVNVTSALTINESIDPEYFKR